MELTHHFHIETSNEFILPTVQIKLIYQDRGIGIENEFNACEGG